MYSLCARFFAMPAVEVGARRASPSPSTHPRLYTYENLPQGPSCEEGGNLLASINGTSPVQIRSRCAILLCAVYGLRVGEVCGLRLEYIDWAAEKISVRCSKQRKVQTYPLTTEVGNALLRYLTSALSKGGQAAMHATRSLADIQAAIPSRLRWRSFHDDSKATEATGTEAQAIRLARPASCLRHAPSRQGADTEGGGRSPGTRVRSSYTNLRQGRSDRTARSRCSGSEAAGCCIEQCEQIAAPFYRVGEIRALRDVGNLGPGSVA